MLRKYFLEILLALSVLSLATQLAWPSMVRWWQRPTPGQTGFASFDAAGGVAANYGLHLPGAYGADMRTWPLVVFLHGSGESGNDVALLQEFRFIGSERDLPAVVTAPQCLPGIGWEPASVIAFVEHVAATYRVDRSRIYLVGPSMGGYGTWQAATAHPELFAAIVPICGGGDPEQATSLAEMPIWAFHGANDDVVPLTESERMIEAVRAAGGKPILTILSDAGHGICEDVCQREDLWEWLFQQRRRTVAYDSQENNNPRVH